MNSLESVCSLLDVYSLDLNDNNNNKNDLKTSKQKFQNIRFEFQKRNKSFFHISFFAGCLSFFSLFKSFFFLLLEWNSLKTVIDRLTDGREGTFFEQGLHRQSVRKKNKLKVMLIEKNKS